MNQYERTPYQYLFLINPHAGRYHQTTLSEQIRQIFDKAGLHDRCQIRLTEYAGHATKLAGDFSQLHGAQGLVMSCGGDGTAHEVANALAGTETVMGILPLGTANDFAKAALSTLNLPTLLEHLLDPDVRRIDIIRVNQRSCLNITSLGFDTKVLSKARALNGRFRRLGALSYPIAVVISLFGRRNYPVAYSFVNAEGRTINGRAGIILAAICNGRYYGGGFNPTPGTSLYDGLIEVCLVDSLSLFAMLPLIGKYKKGTHIGHPAVHIFTVRSGTFKSDNQEDLTGNYDGEIFTLPEIDFKVMEGRLRFAFY